MLWRCGVASFLIVVMLVLIANLWFHDPDGLAMTEPPGTSAQRYGRAETSYGASSSTLLATVAPSAPATRTFDAGGGGVLLVEANAGGAAQFTTSEPPRLRDVVGGGGLDHLDLSRLPRALSTEGDTGGPERPDDPQAAPPLPPEPKASEAVAVPRIVPVARPRRPEQATQLQRPQPAADLLPSKGPAPRPHVASSEKTAEAQRKLLAAGYEIGQADGRAGPRTEAAVREFQKAQGMEIDGRIDDRLLSRLDADLRHRDQLRQHELEAKAAPPPRKPEPEQRRGTFASMMGGLQRLVGRDFNSTRRPEEITSYCRINPDTWIYDFGREAFVFCGNINAGGMASLAAGKAAETAANR